MDPQFTRLVVVGLIQLTMMGILPLVGVVLVAYGYMKSSESSFWSLLSQVGILFLLVGVMWPVFVKV